MWDKLADKKTINNTIASLKKNGIIAILVNSKEEALKKAQEFIPEGSEVMTMTSATIKGIGLDEIINNSGKYDSVRGKLSKMNRDTQKQEMKKLTTAPEYAIGSVHAVTEDGCVLIASNTGSQLPAYVYGARHVIWVVGAQKIVKNTDEGIKRIYEYTLKLESERANKAYNITTGSFVSKLLIVNREIEADRLKIIFVNEKIGF